MQLFKTLAVAFAVVFIALTAWRWRHQLGATAGGPAKPIVFDNGSVRAPTPPASDVASGPVAEPQTPPGAMRKCVRRSEVIYTDRACPNGMKEQAIDARHFNTVGH